MSTQAVAVTNNSAAIGPVTVTERIDVLDVLRGFALWGILLIHVAAFNRPGVPPGLLFEGSLTDRFVVLATLLFVESKFFSLFSFLFGLGFAIQLLRAQARGVPLVPRFARRLLILLGFGILHVVLLWNGDILVIYALVGFLLLLFRNRSPHALLRWVLGLLLIPLVFFAGVLTVIEVLRHMPFYAAQIQEAEASFAASFAQASTAAVEFYNSSTYGTILRQRIAEYVVVLSLLVSRIPSILAMFLLGLYVGKRGIVQRVGEHIALLRRVRLWGLSGGLCVSTFVVMGLTQLGPLSALMALFFNQALAGPVLAMGYAATIVLLAQRQNWRRRLAPLGATGRMALTNYIMQSVIYTTLFYGYGFSLAGQVSATAGVLLATGIFALQTVWSLWWLQRFQFGPLEWVWRSLTYGRWQPLRRAMPAKA